MTRTLTLSVDQLYRPQPGGIGTYVRGLVQGLSELSEFDMAMVGLAPRGPIPPDARALALDIVRSQCSSRLLTRLWPYWPFGVPRSSQIVHATSMAGPFGGGVRGAVHSVAVHDLLWRDAPEAATRHGVHFHEERLRFLSRRVDIRIFTSSPNLAERLIAEGFGASRIHPVRLGVDDEVVTATSQGGVRDYLARHGVSGPFTLHVGTREPRKNIERLISAHRIARMRNSDLGPLVLAGSAGWGNVDVADATVLGVVDREMLKGLYRDAATVAYVALAEGWGFPPVEALHAGTRVVASTTVPSVATNSEVVHVDGLDIESIAHGLERSMALTIDDASSARRRGSVADLTWANAALDHLAGWQ